VKCPCLYCKNHPNKAPSMVISPCSYMYVYIYIIINIYIIYHIQWYPKLGWLYHAYTHHIQIEDIIYPRLYLFISSCMLVVHACSTCIVHVSKSMAMRYFLVFHHGYIMVLPISILLYRYIHTFTIVAKLIL
jgi:hypothetical protein